MNLNSTITIPDTLFSQEVDDETIVLDTTTQEYFNFSDLGKVIWDMLVEENTLLEIYEELDECLDIESDVLTNDIINFIKSLENLSLIKIENK